MDFSWFDIVVGVLILFLAIRGAINGFIREFFGLVGIVGGVYIASVYAVDAGNWISANLYAFKNPSAISLVGFLALLIVIWVGALLVAEVLQRLVSLSSLGALNRLLGFLFGALKIFMILAIILVALTQIQIAKVFIEDKMKGSYLYPILRGVGHAVIKLDVVQEATEEVTPALENLQENLQTTEQ